MNPSIYVKGSSLFSSMVLTLAATRIHQLYFVNDAMQPIGCVPISAVLRILVNEDGQ